MALTPPTIIDDPLRASDQSRAAVSEVGQAADSTSPQPDGPNEHPQPFEQRSQGRDGDPYDGSPKVSVSMRATKELWDRLGALSRRLEDEGLRSSRTELTEALWHFHAPETPDEARELVHRYRRARLG